MANKEMKTLNGYEIVDEKARESVGELSKENATLTERVKTLEQNGTGTGGGTGATSEQLAQIQKNKEDISQLKEDLGAKGKLGYPDYEKKTTLGTGRYEGVVTENGYVRVSCAKSTLSESDNAMGVGLYINDITVELFTCEIFYIDTPCYSELYPVKKGDIVKLSPVYGGGTIECVFYPLIDTGETDESLFEGGIILTDTVTGKRYELSVASGKLTMEEVSK
jgi:hypothetical protein